MQKSKTYQNCKFTETHKIFLDEILQGNVQNATIHNIIFIKAI